MRFVPLSCLCEGMVLGRDLYGRNGEFLLKHGSLIQDIYIGKIGELGFEGVYIEDDLSKDIAVNELISDNLKHRTVTILKNTFTDIERGVDINTEAINQMTNFVNEIVDNIMKSGESVVNMVDLKVFDDYTFYHSVNVTVLSIVTGIAMNLDRYKLYKLGVTALLHDIGKVFIPREILNKPGRLNDDELQVMKSHSQKGYAYLKEKFNVSVATYVGILQHHERYDGKGYPLEISGSQISLFGRIITVSDVYDALTSPRPYRPAMSPSEAIEYVMGAGGVLFDPEVVNNFIKRVVPYPVGTCVKLSDGRVGIIARNYVDCTLRPRIKIIKQHGRSVEPYFIDMKNDSATLGVTITDLVKDIAAMG